MQEDLQDDEIRAQELSAKRAKLSADRMPETEWQLQVSYLFQLNTVLNTSSLPNLLADIANLPCTAPSMVLGSFHLTSCPMALWQILVLKSALWASFCFQPVPLWCIPLIISKVKFCNSSWQTSHGHSSWPPWFEVGPGKLLSFALQASASVAFL